MEEFDGILAQVLETSKSIDSAFTIPVYTKCFYNISHEIPIAKQSKGIILG